MSNKSTYINALNSDVDLRANVAAFLETESGQTLLEILRRFSFYGDLTPEAIREHGDVVRGIEQGRSDVAQLLESTLQPLPDPYEDEITPDYLTDDDHEELTDNG